MFIRFFTIAVTVVIAFWRSTEHILKTENIEQAVLDKLNCQILFKSEIFPLDKSFSRAIQLSSKSV